MLIIRWLDWQLLGLFALGGFFILYTNKGKGL
jgi:hypothetical protein